MAAKKKAAEPKASAVSQDVQPIEQPDKVFKSSVEDTSALTPVIDPSLSRDFAHSTVSKSSLEFPPDQGNQMEEQPGKPKAAKD